MADLATIGFRAETGDLDRATRKLDSLSESGKKVDGTMASLKKSIGLVGAALATVGIAASFKGVIDETSQLQRNMLKLDALIKSTGKTSQITTEELHESARQFALATLDSTEGVMAAQSIMLTFKKISVDSYDEVTEAALNLSRVTGQNLSSAMTQLGKALEDPIAGISAMSRSGASFSQSQKSTIKSLAETGDALAAQNLILKELSTQYGGVARSEAMQLAGAEDTLGQRVQEFNLALDSNLGLSEATAAAYNSMSGAVLFATERIDDLIAGVKTAAAVVGVGLAASMAGAAKEIALTAASTVAYNVRLAQMTGLTGAYATAAGIAATATRAFGVAVKFLMGPWGLLASAVAAGVVAFIGAKDSSDELSASLGKQSKSIKELTAEFEKKGKAELGSAIASATIEQNKLLEQQASIKAKINKLDLQQGSRTKTKGMKELNQDLLLVGASIESSSASLDNLKAALDRINLKESLKPPSEEELQADEYKKWLDSVVGYRTPLQKLTDEIEKINDAIDGGLPVTEGVRNKLAELNAQVDEFNKKEVDTSYQDWIDSIEASTGQIDKLKGQIVEVWMAMDAGDISAEAGLEFIDQLESRIESLKGTVKDVDLFGDITSSIGDSLNAMKGFTSEGSKGFAQLSVAADAFNAVQAVGAVINQATSGDPFSAFPRMAAMITAMASLGQSTGSIGGGLENTSADNQAAQGLNVWGDKADSISNSIDITAEATSDLVGINSGMLKALQSVQAGISSAAGLSLRGVRGSTFDTSESAVNTSAASDFVSNFTFEGVLGSSSINKALDIAGGASLGASAGMIFGPVGALAGAAIGALFEPIMAGVDKLIGGSKKVTDEGIRIVGGTLGDLMEDITVQSFQEVKSKKYRWSKTKTKEYYDDLAEASTQFGLVFDSLADAVFQGGVQLGMNGDELERAINEFTIQTTKISLMDLSLEEQQAEIEAVFSQIFDNLASATIPFVTRFKQAGEGAGEALARLASQVSVAEFAIENLGIKIVDKLVSPGHFVQVSENLSMLTGGLELFSTKVGSFFNDFAPESAKFELNSKAMTEALESVGLAVPDTAEGFFDLMDSINGNDEAGQAQIATLLNIQSIAGDYYDLLEDRQSKAKAEEEKILAEQQAELDKAQSELDSFNSSLSSLSDTLRGAVVSIYGSGAATSNVALDAALQAARLGDFSKALSLDLSNINPQMEGFSSLEMFNIEQAKTANKLADLADLASATATVDDMMLTANQQQVDILTSINSTLSGNSSDAYVSATNIQNSDKIAGELKLSNEVLINELKESNSLMREQNKYQAESANSLDRIVNVGVEIVA